MECVRRAEASEGVDIEVVVVDNASTDGSVEALSPLLPEDRLVANRQNCGFGAANDQAWERATGRYVLLSTTTAMWAVTRSRRVSPS